MEDVERKDYAPPSNPTSLSHQTTHPDYGDHIRFSDDEDDESSKYSDGASLSTGRTATLNRTITRRETVLSAIRSRPPIGRFTHPLEQEKTTSADLVEFDGDNDPYHPVNWTMKKKIITTVLYGLTTMSATWASATFSPGTSLVARQFGVGNEVAVLGTSLYLFGFGLGPLLWAPCSEVFGRRMAVLPPIFISAMFSFGTGAAKDIQTVMITRFFAAFFASAPVTNTGGVLADLFPASQRGIALAGYSLAVVGGPVLGPLVGAALIDASSWRMTEYFSGILQLTILLLDVIFVDESYPPRLLVYKARRLRYQSGNWALHAKFEEWDVTFSGLVRKYFVRPLQLIQTPICLCVCIYASFVYGILYMMLGAIPLVFREERGWPLVSSILPFLGILVGAFIGVAINIYNQVLYNKEAKGKVMPELRLPPMMLGSFAFSAGLFIFGWTADPQYPWIAPIIGLTLAGMGFFTIFQAALNYLVDTFSVVAASAVAANTFLRSCFAGAFPLVITPLYHNIGVPWGTSIFAFFAMALIPIPFLFWRYGKRLRAANKWSRDSVS